MGNKEFRSLYQICNDALDKGKLVLPVNKCSEYFIDMAHAVGFNVDLLKTGNSKNSSMKIHEENVGFVIGLIKDYKEEDYRNLRKGKYTDVPMAVREMLLGNFCDMLRRSGASEDVMIETWRKLRLTMHMDLDPIVQRFDAQTMLLADLKVDLLDDISIANEDRDALLAYYSSQISNLIADLKHIKNLFCSIREKEMDDIIQLETLEADPDKRNSIKGIRLIKEIRDDEDYLFAMKMRKEIMEKGGQISKKRKELEKLDARIDAIGRMHCQKIFGEEYKDLAIHQIILKDPFEILLEAKKRVEEYHEMMKEIREENKDQSI